MPTFDFGKDPNEGVSRFLYKPEWVDAQNALKSLMNDEGLVANYDEVGNLFGRLECTLYKDMCEVRKVRKVRITRAELKELMKVKLNRAGLNQEHVDIVADVEGDNGAGHVAAKLAMDDGQGDWYFYYWRKKHCS